MIYIYPQGEYARAIKHVRDEGKDFRIVTSPFTDPQAEAVYCPDEKIAAEWEAAEVKLLELPESEPEAETDIDSDIPESD